VVPHDTGAHQREGAVERRAVLSGMEARPAKTRAPRLEQQARRPAEALTSSTTRVLLSLFGDSR